MKFLMDQVTSEKRYNMLKEDIFINHSFNEKHFFELKKKKEVSFERKNSNVIEQSTSVIMGIMVDNIITNLQELIISVQDNVAPWQEILKKEVPITKAEFHCGLNSIRDSQTLTTYCNGMRKGRRARGVTHDYIINQCAIRARKIEQSLWY
ncbi:hypothetical protein RhiirA1_460503 [Rhizophagus irregularis]|uniref:Uncharacterized protein n=1 Tax=Rhizophagus irregularis TaxID=588596 RepID=A0A2I1EJK3_9GLOM|nr:hypothetical protein RhiirA1_460503 [Rhizophagus irregularis]PKY22313.1 hypothetical protein RhiirB3_436214 [Rhizophagus irregularis]CAB4489185.1 unnamed protein product [Rhizophagus irregularis]